jgi:hypothetical protein
VLLRDPTATMACHKPPTVSPHPIARADGCWSRVTKPSAELSAVEVAVAVQYPGRGHCDVLTPGRCAFLFPQRRRAEITFAAPTGPGGLMAPGIRVVFPAAVTPLTPNPPFACHPGSISPIFKILPMRQGADRQLRSSPLAEGAGAASALPIAAPRRSGFGRRGGGVTTNCARHPEQARPRQCLSWQSQNQTGDSERAPLSAVQAIFG